MADPEGPRSKPSRPPRSRPRRISFTEALRREKERQRLRRRLVPQDGRGPGQEGEGNGVSPEGVIRESMDSPGISPPTTAAERKARALDAIVELEEEVRRLQRAIVRLEEEMAGGEPHRRDRSGSAGHRRADGGWRPPKA